MSEETKKQIDKITQKEKNNSVTPDDIELKISLEKQAIALNQRLLPKQNKDIQQRILSILNEILQFPLEGKPLLGILKGKYSWRTGKYRIIYSLIDDKLQIFVIKIGLRKKVYE